MHGASASVGNVYEPYLPFTTNLGVFASALLAGGNIAESYYMAQPVLSWMSILVGDPLYRPYACLSGEESAPSTQGIWSDYRRLVMAHGGDVLAAASDLKTRAGETKESLYLEALGAAEMDAGFDAAAVESFSGATLFARDQLVTFRLLLEQVRALEKEGKAEEVKALLKTALSRFTAPPQQSLIHSWIVRTESSLPTPSPSSTHMP